ncbi:MAG: hypothetical protein AB8C46_22385 [Burkholderiaceae bacterium]
MQVTLLASYLTSLSADPFALVMSISILYTGYLLFGQEPTQGDD